MYLMETYHAKLMPLQAKLVTIRWRKRHFIHLLLACGVIFILSLIISNSVLDESKEHNGHGRRQDEKDNHSTGGVHIVGANSTGLSVIVQLWPKNSLELLEKIDARVGRRRRKEASEESTRISSSNVEKLVPISNETVPCSPSNRDCQRFRALLRSWPPHKPKAAFYILTQPGRLKLLKNALESIDKNFNSKFSYPVIIFHESDLISFIPSIRNLTTSDLFFQEISFYLPDFIDKPVKFGIPCLSHIGYRHMCRFHAKGVFQTPIMRGLDYYWRLDDDSLLLRDISYDVFSFMRQKHLVYGYNWQNLDSYQCTYGLWNATRAYINDTKLRTQFFNEWRDPQIYYNNFEISDLSLWLSKDYANFIDYIDKLGGIYYHRWGDAPIKGIAVSMFVPKSKLHKFSDIGYQHRSFINK